MRRVLNLCLISGLGSQALRVGLAYHELGRGTMGTNGPVQTAVLFSRALVAHERELRELRQVTDVEFLLYDEGTEQQVRDALAEEGEGLAAPRVRALRAVARRLVQDNVAGGSRLLDASDQTAPGPTRQAIAPHIMRHGFHDVVLQQRI